MVIQIPIASTYNNKGAKEAESSLGMLGESAKKLAAGFGLAFGVEKIAEFTKKSIEAYGQNQKQLALLSNTLKNVGLGFEAAATGEFITRLSLATGKTKEELIPAFNTLIRATGDATESQKLLNLALNISAGTGKDVETVSLALTKAYGGNSAALGRLGLGISSTDLKHKTFTQNIDTLTKMFQGDAAVAADSFGGKIDRLKVAFNEAQVTIGQGFVDAFTNVSSSTSFNGFIEGIHTVAQDVADTVSGFGQLAGKINNALPGLGVIKNIIGQISNFGILGILREQGANARKAAEDAAKPTLDALKYQEQLQVAADKKHLVAAKAAAAAQQAAAEKAQAAAAKAAQLAADQLKTEQARQRLIALGITPTDTNQTQAIEYEAARLNLIKQQQLGVQAVSDAQLNFLNVQLASNDAASKYLEILNVIADQKISSAEVEALSIKWGMSQSQVIAYIEKVTGIQNIKIDTTFQSAQALAWDQATQSLNNYLKGLIAVQNQQATGGTGSTSGSANTIVIPPYSQSSSSIFNPNPYALGTPATQSTYVSSSVSTFGATAASNTNGAFGSNLSAKANESPTVVVNVGGSVVSQTDLVNAVQYGILGNKLSGKAVEYNQIAL